MSARKYSDVVKGRPGEASSSSDMNSWMRTFQQENEDEALKIVQIIPYPAGTTWSLCLFGVAEGAFS